MAAVKCVVGTETQADALQAIVSKALGYPKIGTHVGGGIHVPMAPTWDGTGPCPVGWTKHAIDVWKLDANNTGVPLPDTLVPLLQAAPALAKLTAPEQATLAAAIAARINQDLELGGYVPKVVVSA